jgi:hypothetical protein
LKIRDLVIKIAELLEANLPEEALTPNQRAVSGQLEILHDYE